MAVAERWKGHPPLPADLEGRLSEVVARLRGAGAGLVYLFGSAAQRRGEGHPPPGDLDLAVWGMDEEPWRVRADLEEVLGTDRLDLMRLEAADPDLRFEVVACGRLLFSEGPALENAFEAKVLREYRDLAPFRRVQRTYLRRRHGIDGP
ncbi:MAG TPA: nucleotidyltransferase domain-containing protein [Longimicrobiales bacterium]|nr:nucleotidyltransferase domain-containing protein [Longimicrobiales bacterium]